MLSEKITNNPFGEIAVCMSGGGYRAAAFHLGTLKMLNELGLLNEVKFLSTASGGTILAAAFTLAKINSNGFTDGTCFEDFSRKFRNFLAKTNVIDSALENLYKTPSPTNTNDLSLIRSAANVYDDELFNYNAKKTFDVLLDDVNSKNPNFRDVIFNATDFQHGNDFRFRAMNNPNIKIGNGKQSVNLELAKKLRLADIVAASSCFPGAFEPIRFPQDFVFDRANPIQPFEDERIAMVPLMDGGIYDNQGVAAMTVSYPETGKSVPFGLMIVSDTCQRNDNYLPFPSVPRKGFVPIWLWWTAIITFFVAMFCSWLAILVIKLKPAVSTIWEKFGLSDDLSKNMFWDAFLYNVFPFVLETLALAAFIFVFFKWASNLVIKISGEDFRIWQYLKGLTRSDLWTLGMNRLESTKAMTFEVFMKRIRTLTINLAMKDPNFNDKIAFNYIYDLNSYCLFTDEGKKKDDRDVSERVKKVIEADPNLECSIKLMELSEKAEAVPTTLWFDKSMDHIGNLVECGRISGYFSLLKYMQEYKKDEIKKSGSAYAEAYELILKRWEKFK